MSEVATFMQRNFFTQKCYQNFYPLLLLLFRLFVFQSMHFDFRLANLIGFHNYLYYTSFMASTAIVRTISIPNCVFVFIFGIWNRKLTKSIRSWILCSVHCHCLELELQYSDSFLCFNKKILNKLYVQSLVFTAVCNTMSTCFNFFSVVSNKFLVAISNQSKKKKNKFSNWTYNFLLCIAGWIMAIKISW